MRRRLLAFLSARLQPKDRALLAALSRQLPRARWSVFLVKPETLFDCTGAWCAADGSMPRHRDDGHRFPTRCSS